MRLTFYRQPQNPENFHLITSTNGSYRKVTSEWSIVYNEGSKVIFPINIVRSILSWQTVQTLMNFIWVFAVCQSTCTIPVYGFSECQLSCIKQSLGKLPSKKFRSFVINELVHEISNNVVHVCATSKGSDQPVHERSLIWAFASRLSIPWVLSYWPNIISSF